MTTSIRVAIVGAGMGGLALAKSLTHLGFRNVCVLERNTQLRPALGAGFALSTARIIATKIGLGNTLEQVSVPLVRLSQKRWRNDRTLGEFTINPDTAMKDYGISPDVIFAAVPRYVALKCFADSLPPGVLRFGSEVKEITQLAHDVQVRLTNGTTINADIVVGADGLRSTVRRLIFGDDKPPTFSGHAVFHGVASIPRNIPNHPDIDKAFQSPGVTQIYDRGTYAGFYPIRTTSEEENLLFYLVHKTNKEKDESWELDSTKEYLTSWLSEKEQSCGYPTPAVFSEIVSRASRLVHFGMFYRPKMPILKKQWHSDRVVLLGDAAHATLPYLGQGANMAVEDAYSLAKMLYRSSLKTKNDIEAVLSQYHSFRYSSTNKRIIGAHWMGKLELSSSFLGCFLRDTFLAVHTRLGLTALAFAKMFATAHMEMLVVQDM